MGGAFGSARHKKAVQKFRLAIKAKGVGFDVWCDYYIACARSGAATEWVGGGLQKQNQ